MRVTPGSNQLASAFLRPSSARASSSTQPRALDSATRVAGAAKPTVSVRSAAEVYLDVATPIALRQIAENVGRSTDQRSPLTGAPTPTLAGGVIASASANPDYRFVWDRDAALVMRPLVGLMPSALADYVAFSRGRQGRVATEVFDPKTLKPARGFEWAERWLRKDPSLGLGEPRELPNGAFDPFQWSRPQTDGPALRALTMLDLLAEPLEPTLREQVIAALRVDLDYVARVWPEASFDLWEETLAGKHYYTREVQAAALHGACGVPELAEQAPVYAEAAKMIDAERERFWNGSYIRASLDVKARDGHTAKTTDLDANVILAAIHSGRIDSRVLATARLVELRDQKLFPLNGDVSKRLGTAIGRYDGDTYFGGNPFYMLTLGFAELCYQVAARITTNGLDVDADNRDFLASALTHGEFLEPGASFAPGSLEASRTAAALVAKGDAFVNRVARHARITPDGKGGYVLPLPEQFDKVDGTPRSAPDLTWSNAALVSAARAREAATRAEPRFPFNHTVDDVLRSPDAASAFVEDFFDHEAPFFQAARDFATGLAFDGVDLDPKTGQLSGRRRMTATSKECTDVAVITKILTGDPLALRLMGKDVDPRASALAILARKIDSYERFDREYPGYGGFMPWIKIGADGSLGPADKHWETNVPSLDNGEWMFTLLAVEHVLRQQGETALADRYKAWNDKLARNVKRVFWDEEKQAVRVQAKISDIRDPNAKYASHEGDAFIRGPHGVHEGAMILHYMSLYANPGITPAQVKHLWSETRMEAVEHKHGTTWQGYWGSPHEEWEFLIMPKRDQEDWAKLFRIRQKLRTQDAVERGKPGFGASINAPDSGPQEGAVVPYAGDHGIPSIAYSSTTDYPFYAIYGVFSLLLEQANTPERREGVAWLLNTLRARDAVTSMGAGESVNNDGSKASPMKTIDGSFLNWLGLMGGLCDEVRDRMKADGTYAKYQEILRGEYRETFGDKPLNEPTDFAAPRVSVPWTPPRKPMSVLAVRSSSR